jgi:hypothetical protein
MSDDKKQPDEIRAILDKVSKMSKKEASDERTDLEAIMEILDSRTNEERMEAASYSAELWRMSVLVLYNATLAADGKDVMEFDFKKFSDTLHTGVDVQVAWLRKRHNEIFGGEDRKDLH